MTAIHPRATGPHTGSRPGHVPTSNLRVRRLDLLTPPRDLLAELPLGDEQADVVEHGRVQVGAVLGGDDDRLVVVAGPCSIHDPVAVREYAELLRREVERHTEDLVVVMRAYFEKPRTTVGWKGLINDPDLDGGHDVERGLRLARSVLLDILDLGLPVGCEFLEPTSPQYLADAVSWGAIGARTPESQVHRQLASGLSMPVGFKNASDGHVGVAIDGCLTAAAPHVFFGIDDDGRAAVVSTTGNPDCHVVLRGGRTGPNADPVSVAAALRSLRAAGRPERLVVDASHGNSGKDHRRQPDVARQVAAQVAAGQHGIAGVMLESFLVAGRQEPTDRPLVYGQSVTDACMDATTTVGALDDLAAAVRARRRVPLR